MRIHFAHFEETKKVAERFGLEWNMGMQDWPIEVADPKRIKEFSDSLSMLEPGGEMICTFELVLASFDDFVEESAKIDSDLQWTKIKDQIFRISGYYPDIIEYWATAALPSSEYLKEYDLFLEEGKKQPS